MERGILFGAGVSLAAMISGHAEAGQSDLRKACVQEAKMPTPDDKSGIAYADMVPDRAIEICRRALDAAPADAAIMANLARALYKAERYAEALPLLERAVKAGNIQALNTLTNMYKEGRGVAKDPARAFAYSKAAEHRDNVTVAGILGDHYMIGIGTPVDTRRGLAFWARSAELGNALAANALGETYRQGSYGVTRDPALARRWYSRAMALGHDDAVAALAFMIDNGLGGTADPVEARKLYKVASDRGSGWGAENLGWMFQVGRGGAKDPVEAARYIRLAVDRGQTSAMRRLGNYYRDGTGVERDIHMAIAWYRKAADAEDDDAMVELGDLAASGKGMPRDEAASRDWYRKAAEAGNARGMRKLAYDLASSEFTGVPSDNPAALKWYHKLAETDDPKDAAFAADALAEGKAVPLDLKAARKYYEKALAGGVEDSARPLVETVLRDNPLDAERAYALRILTEHAGKGEGWALAALAHPGPMIAAAGLRIDSAAWRAKIATLTDSKALTDVAQALQAGKLAKQQFGLAVQYAKAASDPSVAKEYQLKLMLDLKLQEAALRELARYAEGEEFKALPEDRRTALLAQFDTPYAFNFNGDASYIPLFEALAKLGMREAAAKYAWRLLDDGAGDPVAALKWFEIAAERGSADAQRAIGYLHLKGFGVEKSAVKAVRAWEEAYRRGETSAAMSLALYYKGELEFSDAERAGAPQVDRAQAFEWMQRAASFSYANAVLLARMYLAGDGTKANPKEAIRLLRWAVHCGDYSARVALGEAYLHGSGVAKDPEMALRWFKHAAGTGWSGGALAMVRASALGWGMKADAKQTRYWLAEAVRRGSDDAKKWQEACGAQATIKCLIKIEGFTPIPIGPQTEGVTAEPAFESREALLRKDLDAAVENGSEFAVFEGFRSLEEHYLLYGKMDQYLATKVRSLAIKEAALTNRFGSRDNYFALIESSCHWSSAAKEANGGGRREAALFFAKVAVNKLQDARKRISDLDPSIRECFIRVHQDRYRYLAGIFMEMGRFGEAEHVLAMLKDFESYNYTRDKRREGEAFDQMPLDAKQTQSIAAFDAATAALAQAGAARDRLIALQRQGTLTAEQQQELAAATTALGAAQTAFRGELGDLANVVAGLDAAMTPDQEAKADRVAAIQPRLISTVRRLGKDVAALHAVVLPDSIHWLITTANYQKSVVVPVDITAMRKEVGLYRQAISDKAVFITDPASKLYQSVFEPVDKALRAAGIRQVMLSLDDALRYLPMAALHDGKQWLAERYAFSAFRSIDEVQTGPSDATEWRVAALGASQGGAGLSPLPAVPAELSGIVRAEGRATGVFPGVVSLDGAFDRAALGAAMAGGYRVIHIASHFALDPASADKSFLLLGTGKELPLTDFIKDGSFTAIDVDLLALSACQTGVPGGNQNGSEVDASLAELAQKAGASAVLASLWSVADESTAVLMQRFYAIHSKGGTSKAEALRQAQFALMTAQGATGVDRGKGRSGPDGPTGPAVTGYAHPFYWAPFVLLGNWQ
ncbi:CHAT domain-containing protein [Sphingomonas sp. R647]|uniref:CHAT domain-containing protein n=1 Tax=Sphingomonas sp. R647 TaxID=2875233 RepID=UPI001CD7CBAB|nr:CHAT domain-containing protein [Sphingomonas sp. R647]MCA1197497.1 CHAT domain-containing protein [Sphingomonas sp. R647]